MRKYSFLFALLLALVLIVSSCQETASTSLPATSPTPTPSSALNTDVGATSEKESTEEASPLPSSLPSSPTPSPVCPHQFDPWQEVKAPTCLEEGSQKRTCLLCHMEQTEALPKSQNHTFTEERLCSICGTAMDEGFLFEENGDGESYSFSYTGTAERITVPSFFNGLPVTGIKRISGSVKDILLPEGIVEIGSYAFMNCKKLTTIRLPEGVTLIGMEAFSGCEMLRTVELPATLSFIGKKAFCGIEVRQLTVKYNGTAAQWIALQKDVLWIDEDVNYILTFSAPVVLPH